MERSERVNARGAISARCQKAGGFLSAPIMSCGALGCAPTYADFAEQLLAVVAELEALESFSPCVTTDAAFTKLVELYVKVSPGSLGAC